MLFYNAVSFLLIQKSPAPRNLTPKNQVNFKLTSETFATLFTPKSKFTDLLIINLKGYEILVVKFIEKFTD